MLSKSKHLHKNPFTQSEKHCWTYLSGVSIKDRNVVNWETTKLFMLGFFFLKSINACIKALICKKIRTPIRFHLVECIQNFFIMKRKVLPCYFPKMQKTTNFFKLRLNKYYHNLKPFFSLKSTTKNLKKPITINRL